MKSISKLFFQTLLVLVGLVGGASSAFGMKLPLTRLPNPSIQAPLVALSGCIDERRDTRQAAVTIRINPADMGRPGIAFVGIHDREQDEAYFLRSDGRWQKWGGSTFEPNRIFYSGLQDSTVIIPIQEMRQAINSWHLYIGYGTLSVQNEMTVERFKEALANTKLKIPGKNVQSVDPEYLKFTLIQQDMTELHKYMHILRFDSNAMQRDCIGSGNF